MPKKYFNWKLAVVIVLCLGLLALTAYWVNKRQKSSRAERYLSLGNKAYNERNWDAAASNLGRYIGITGGDANSLNKYAQSQSNIRPLKINNIEQAVAAYRNILRNNNNNIETSTKLTELYLSIGNPSEAELIAKRQIDLADNPELKRLYAISLAKQRKTKEAYQILDEMIKKNPDFIPAYETIGKILEQNPDISTVLPMFWFEQAIKNNPDSALAYINRFAYYYRNAMPQKADEDLAAAEQKDTASSDIRLKLAEQYILSNQFDKAKKHLDQIKKSDPTNSDLWSAYAQMAVAAKDPNQMPAVADEGLKNLNAYPWDFMPLAAELYIRSNMPDKASDCIEKLDKRDFSKDITAFLRALLAEQKKNTNEAVKYWKQALQAGNKSPDVRLSLARNLDKLGDIQSAISQLKTLASENPDNYQAMIELSKMFSKTGDSRQASDYARKAMEIKSTSYEAVLLYLHNQIELIGQKSGSMDASQILKLKKLIENIDSQVKGDITIKIMQLKLQLALNNLADAEKTISDIKSNYPKSIQTLLAEADYLIAANPSAAAEYLIKVSGEYPDAYEPVAYLISIYMKQNDFAACEKIIADKLKSSQDLYLQKKLTLLSADLYSDRKLKDKAIQILSAFSSKYPDDLIVKRKIIALNSDNYQKAQQAVDEMKNAEGADGWQWKFEQSKVWYNNENFKTFYSQIVSLLKENILQNPDDIQSRLLLAASHEKAQNMQLAIATYEETLTRAPYDLNVIIAAVSAYYRTNQYDKADAILQNASNVISLDSNFEQLKLQGYLLKGNIEPAVSILEKLISADPNNLNTSLTLAIIKIKQNNFEQAEKMLNILNEKYPESIPVKTAEIELLLKQNDNDKALAIANILIDKLQNAVSYNIRAKLYSYLNKNEKALDDIEKAIAIEPNNISTLITKSDMLRSSKQPQQALIPIEKALLIEPNNINIISRAVTLYLNQPSPQMAQKGKELLNRGLIIYPQDADLLLIRAKLLLLNNTADDITNAVIMLTAITDKTPQIPEAWLLLGQIAFNNKDYSRTIDSSLRGLANNKNDKSLMVMKAQAEQYLSPEMAAATLQTLQDLYPADYNIAGMLSNVYAQQNLYQKAIDNIQNLIIKDNNSLTLKLLLATSLYKKGDANQAIQLVDSLYKSHPTDAAVLLNYINLLAQNKQFEQAQKIIDDFANKNQQSTDVLIYLAENISDNKDKLCNEMSVKILSDIISRRPDNLRAINSLAIIYHKAEQYDKAADLYKKIIEAQPQNIAAMNNLASILCENQNDCSKALEITEKAIIIEPNYLDLIDTQGTVYFKLGNYTKAFECYSKCAKLYPPYSPSSVTAKFHLAKTYVKLDKKLEAAELLKAVLDLNERFGGLDANQLQDAKKLLDLLSK